MIVDREESRPDCFHDELLRVPRRLDDLADLLRVHRQWLLAKHVLALLQRGNAQITMDLLDRSNVGDVHVLIGEQLFLRAVRAHLITELEVANELLRLALVARRHSDDLMLPTIAGQQRQAEILADTARTDDTPFQLHAFALRYVMIRNGRTVGDVGKHGEKITAIVSLLDEDRRKFVREATTERPGWMRVCVRGRADSSLSAVCRSIFTRSDLLELS